MLRYVATTLFAIYSLSSGTPRILKNPAIVSPIDPALPTDPVIGSIATTTVAPQSATDPPVIANAPQVTAPRVTTPVLITPAPTTHAPTPWVLPPGRVIPPFSTPSPSVLPPGGVPWTPSTPSVAVPAPPAPPTPGISILPPLSTPRPSVPTTPSGIQPVPSLPVSTPPLPSAPLVTVVPTVSNQIQPAFENGFFGQSCPVDQYRSFTKCPNTTTSVSDRDGRLQCTQYDAECCLCSAVSCGFGKFGTPCYEFFIGNKGVYGVGDIKVAGSMSDGVIISCYGKESCALSSMEATSVRSLSCEGDRSCEGATVKITDPFTEFELYCSGKAACHALSIQIHFTGPPQGYKCAPGLFEQRQLGQIECLNEASCQNMHFTMDNAGCYQVVLRKVACVDPTACIQSTFRLIGDIQLQECELGTSGLMASGLEQCYQNLLEYQCSEPSSCLGVAMAILNPVNGFEFKCGDSSSCESAHFHFEFNAEGQSVDHLSGFIFDGRYSARGATFTFDNQQNAMIDIFKVDCGGMGSCSGTRFITGPNVQIEEISCSSNSCANCLIQIDAADAGIPCDPQMRKQYGPWIPI